MSENLSGMRVAILATSGFEQSELAEPRQALEAAGAETDVISLREGNHQGLESQGVGR